MKKVLLFAILICTVVLTGCTIVKPVEPPKEEVKPTNVEHNQ